MFIQQPVRVTAAPTETQHVGVTIESLLRMHYTGRMQEMTSPRVALLQMEIINPILVGTNTQVDIMLSLEADTIEDYQQFIRSFIRRETTDDFEIIAVGYDGY